MKTNIEVLGDYTLFLEKILGMVDELDLLVKTECIDHICFRVKTIEEYKNKKVEFLDIADLVTESIVNGRNISTFRLKNPITYKNNTISLVELPAPKQSHSYDSGLEHLEFVTKEPLQKIVDRHPHLRFETFGINKKINPDITLKLGEFCIRFHNSSLDDIIKAELKHKRI